MKPYVKAETRFQQTLTTLVQYGYPKRSMELILANAEREYKLVEAEGETLTGKNLHKFRLAFQGSISDLNSRMGYALSKRRYIEKAALYRMYNARLKRICRLVEDLRCPEEEDQKG